MAPSRKRAKQSKALASAVALWIEEQEATANLWLLVSEPDAPQQIRIPARRDFISHFSELIRSLDADDSECPVIGFYAETVVEFCRACMPHLNGLPQVDDIPERCKLIKLAHFLIAPQLTNHFMNELQPVDLRLLYANDFIAFFDMMRHVGKPISWKKQDGDAIYDFVTAIYPNFSDQQKNHYYKELHEMFTIALKMAKEEDFDPDFFEELAESLLDMARVAFTS